MNKQMNEGSAAPPSYSSWKCFTADLSQFAASAVDKEEI